MWGRVPIEVCTLAFEDFAGCGSGEDSDIHRPSAPSPWWLELSSFDFFNSNTETYASLCIPTDFILGIELTSPRHHGEMGLML